MPRTRNSSPSQQPRLRCAIYTRKSSEEGLDQEFNSLDAQREAAAAYILSQKHEGWDLLPDFYDDGGFSGGNMERPALKRLLKDVEDDRIDIVVVYKVDRLTRSLADFARLVDTFDRYQTSFVAVTQQFNTTTSMGRLTLNILLSFAQFEREVTSERIRDKFALAKKKGMWMGGRVPLGYDVKDRKLVINKKEATLVQFFFQQFQQNHSLSETCRITNRQGYRTKTSFKEGKLTQGGKLWNRSVLYRLLKNRLYLGEIADKRLGVWYPGEHKAIIEKSLWDKVQTVFEKNCQGKQRESRWQNSPAFLKGPLFGPDGLALVPTHTRKNGKLYRYYVSSKGIKESYQTMALPPVPAEDIERTVVVRLGQLMATPEVISRMAQHLWDQPDAEQIQEITASLKRFSSLWQELYNNEQRIIVQTLVERITITDNEIEITLKTKAIFDIGAQIPKECA